MEMFYSKTPGTFLKHLPNATRSALDKSGACAALQRYSTLVSQVQTQGQQIQTYEAGPAMLSGEDPKTGRKVEITVQNDRCRMTPCAASRMMLNCRSGHTKAAGCSQLHFCR
jgi:hypothetical protein